MLYDSLSQRELAMGGIFLNLAWGASEITELENIGEEARLLTREMAGIESVIISHCSALVYLEIRGKAVDYAQILDERLSSFVCPSSVDGESVLH